MPRRCDPFGSYNDPKNLRTELARILDGRHKKGAIPALWDGHAGERIARVVQEYFEKRVKSTVRASA